MREQGNRRPKLFTGAFALVTFSSFGYFLSIGATLPTMPLFVSGPLSGGSIAVGLVAGMFSVTAIVGRPVSGRMGDRIGRKILVTGGSALVAASTALVPLSEALAGSSKTLGIGFMILLRLIMGIGEAFLFTGAVTMIGDLAPEERQGEAVSLFTLSLYGGLALGAPLGELVLDRFGFTVLWLVIAGLATIGMLLALPLPETRPDHPPSTGRRLVHPAALGPGTIMATSVWAFAGFNAFMPLYAREDLGMGGVAPVLFVYSLVIVVVRLVGARIPDVIGPRNSAGLSLGGSAIGLAVIALWVSTVGLYAGSILLALGQSIAFPALMSMAMRGAPPSERAAAVGTFTAFVDIGFGIGPVVAGAVESVAGYGAVFWQCAAAAVLGLVMLAARRERKGVIGAGTS